MYLPRSCTKVTEASQFPHLWPLYMVLWVPSRIALGGISNYLQIGLGPQNSHPLAQHWSKRWKTEHERRNYNMINILQIGQWQSKKLQNMIPWFYLKWCLQICGPLDEPENPKDERMHERFHHAHHHWQWLHELHIAWFASSISYIQCNICM